MMSSNAQKTPFARQLHQFGDVKVQDWLSRQTQGLPCSVTQIMGALVKIKFEVNATPFNLPEILVPKAESPYYREPTQIGDPGFALTSQYYLGGVSGIGGGTADLNPRANLTNIVFQPISKKSAPSVDPNACVVSGPNGFVLQTADKTVSIVGNSSGITITFPGFTGVWNGSGFALNGNVTINGILTVNGTTVSTGEVTGNGIPLSIHTHPGGTIGAGETGPPVP